MYTHTTHPPCGIVQRFAGTEEAGGEGELNCTELNEVGPKVQHIRAARGQGLTINSVAPLREGGPQKVN